VTHCCFRFVLHQYQSILLDDRYHLGTTLPESLCNGTVAGSRTCNIWVSSPVPNLCTARHLFLLNQPVCLHSRSVLSSVAFSALTLLVGCQEEPVKKSDEMLMWLTVWSKTQMICIWSSWCQCHPIISCFIKIHIGFYSAQCSHCKRCISYGNSVRVSHAGIVSKRRHIARCSLHRWIAKCV